MIFDKLNPFKSSKKTPEPEHETSNSLKPAKSTSSVAASIKSIGKVADRVVFLHDIPAPKKNVTVIPKKESPEIIEPVGEAS